MSVKSFKNELMQALQNVSGKDISGLDYETAGEALYAFNTLYTCVVTFALTPEEATLVVKQGTTIIEPEEDGTYALKEGAYTYSVTAPKYTSKIDQALAITNADETTGTKAVTVALSTCVVTFDLTPAEAEVVVKNAAGTVVAAEDGGTYMLPAAAYTYSVTADGYSPVEDKALTISSGDETTGTKTVTEVLQVTGG